MKIQFFKSVLFAAIVLVTGSCAAQQNAGTVSKKVVDKWFKANEWSGGLKLNVYDDVTRAEFYKQYHANKPLWDKAFAYLRDNDLANLPNGKVVIQGDELFANINEPAEKPFEQTAWESHRNYIDLQYIAKGKEKIIAADTSKLTVVKTYDAKRDVAVYTGAGKEYIAKPGTYYLFFPQDAHRPSIKADDELVKKVVLKIRVAK